MIIEKDVKSTAISHVKYDTSSKTLSITFTSTGTYDYPAVPQNEFEGLVAAESVGRYFNTHIRKYSVRA